MPFYYIMELLADFDKNHCLEKKKSPEKERKNSAAFFCFERVDAAYERKKKRGRISVVPLRTLRNYDRLRRA